MLNKKSKEHFYKCPYPKLYSQAPESIYLISEEMYYMVIHQEIRCATPRKLNVSNGGNLAICEIKTRRTYHFYSIIQKETE